MLRTLLLTLILLEASNAHSLSPYSATYTATWKASWFPITVEAHRSLKNIDKDMWQLSFEAYSSVADLSEISQFQFKDEQIKPDSYRYKTSGFLSKKHRLQEFHWDDKKVWLPLRSIFGNYTLEEGIQDNLSFQEQLRLDLAKGKTEFDYKVTYKNRLKHYFFEVAGERKIKLKGQTISAIEVKQTNLKHKKEALSIWFAKDFDHLLIKLHKVRKNGNKHTILLKEAHLQGQTLKGF